MNMAWRAPGRGALAEHLNGGFDPLFGALVNPGPHNSDLFRSERLGRGTEAAPTGAPRTTGPTRSARTSRTTAGRAAGAIWPGTATGRPASRSTGSTRATFRRHGHLLIDLRYRDRQQTFLAFARHYHFAVMSPFQHAVQRVQPETGLGPFRPVTAGAGGLENCADIFVIGDTLRLRSGRQLADIDFGDIPIGLGQPAGGGQTEDG